MPGFRRVRGRWIAIPALPGLVLAAALAACGADASRPPDIVLVLIDTLRADRVSSYGYGRATTPRLDALAARGIRFANASSTSSWTLPAHASLFTGLFPIRHGATQERVHLDEGPATLAELLKARGYATLGVSANPLVSRQTGLDRGFERFVDTWRPRARRAAHPNLEAVRDLLAGLPPARPFFLFVNYIEPHGPYLPPEPYRSRFVAERDRARVESVGRTGADSFYLDPASVSQRDLALLSDLYDAEVAHVDALVGELLDFLESEGRLEDALLVVTSDHGENLGDHGHLRHVFSLYESVVRVPLIVVQPGGEGAGRVRSEPVSLVDVFASLLARAGVEPPANLPGRDVLSDSIDAAPVFAEYYYPLQALELFGADPPPRDLPQLRPYLRRLRSVEDGGARLIWSSDGRDELYDLSRDPDENDDLSGDPAWAGRRRALAALLDRYVEAGGGGTPLPEGGAPERAAGEVDAETEARLRELGYLR